jgi:hypothetical protein
MVSCTAKLDSKGVQREDGCPPSAVVHSAVTYCLHDIFQFTTLNLIFNPNHIKSCSVHDNMYFNLHVTLHINLYQVGMF